MAESNLELKELLRCSKKEGNTDAKDRLINSIRWFAPLKEGEFHSYIEFPDGINSCWRFTNKSLELVCANWRIET